MIDDRILQDNRVGGLRDNCLDRMWLMIENSIHRTALDLIPRVSKNVLNSAYCSVNGCVPAGRRSFIWIYRTGTGCGRRSPPAR
ncbi:hypothetical protein [Desulfosediminicola ganghwensis]|uniref:hypothetical protein n=1 Tax=Desulfosediminicola ganghwensis TaxID=2569540 RepID=UPI0010ABA695|nr:hypothetical protein [Desulfosediminicola ganghwensis]